MRTQEVTGGEWRQPRRTGELTRRRKSDHNTQQSPGNIKQEVNEQGNRNAGLTQHGGGSRAEEHREI